MITKNVDYIYIYMAHIVVPLGSIAFNKRGDNAPSQTGLIDAI